MACPVGTGLRAWRVRLVRVCVGGGDLEVRQVGLHGDEVLPGAELPVPVLALVGLLLRGCW